ncbi:MAG: heavy metal translocating P-type ATPase [Candidatus Poseidoniaceae archaeon]
MAGKDEEESFMSLEDEVAKPVKAKSPKKAKKTPKVSTKQTEILDAEILDTTIVEQAGGKYEVDWPLIGMDCPDCASKAMRGLSHLKQVIDPEISVTSGEIKVTVDLDEGMMSQVSNVMKSLGHPPNVPLNLLSSTNAEVIAKRNNIQKKDVKRLMMRQPGVLDVEITKDDEVLLQLVPSPKKELIKLRNESIKNVIGFEPKFAEASTTRLRPDQWRLFGGTIAMPILLLIFIGEFLDWSPIILGLIGAYGVLIGGLQMFHEAIASLLSKQMGFQVLTSIAVIGASILGMWEEALMVVILVAIAGHLENSALDNARELMQGGLDRIPRTARKILNPSIKLGNPKQISAISVQSITLPEQPQKLTLNQQPKPSDEHEVISLDLVNIGDILEVRSGELIPADGVIVDGFGALDKAPLTGESAPVEVEKGDELNAGLVLSRGPVLIEVTAVGEETRLSGLIEAVHSFKDQKAPIQNQIEKFTAIWVPIVLFGAVVIWYFMFPTSNWKIILLLWVVACPCALLLAAAMPHAAALSRASRMGAIVRGGNILERMSKVNHVLLDKTGTLTSGKPTIGSITVAKGRQRKASLALAGGLEKRSSHPYATAVLDYLKNESIEASSVAGITDIEAGVKGFANGKEVSFIRADMAAKHNISVPDDIAEAIKQAKNDGLGASVLTKESTAIALFTFVHDDTREGSGELIHSFLQRGINVEIISGDQQASVTAFAKSIGLPESSALGELSPEDKVKWVEDRSKSHVTMMVGDGFNDSAALAVADIGVAVGTGESVNLEAADIMFPGDEPKMLVDLYDLSVKMNRALIGNIIMSVSITFILVFSVINQFYDQLWVGVLIHEGSVLLVIFNGARLSGKGNILSMLFITTKNLWLDTVQLFKQLKEHYFGNESSNSVLPNQNHATS